MEHFPYLFDFELNGLREFIAYSWDKSEAITYELDEDIVEYEFEKLLNKQKLSIKLVYYELNAIIERELCECATYAWKDQFKPTKPIDKLGIDKIIKLIENKYNIKMSNIENYDYVFDLRQTVNSIKHRQGFVDFNKKQDSGNIKSSIRHKLTIESAHQAIDRVRSFVFSLWEIAK